MAKLGRVIAAACIACTQVVAVGFLLSVGFKLSERVLRRRKELT